MHAGLKDLYSHKIMNRLHLGAVKNLFYAFSFSILPYFGFPRLFEILGPCQAGLVIEHAINLVT